MFEAALIFMLVDVFCAAVLVTALREPVVGPARRRISAFMEPKSAQMA